MTKSWKIAFFVLKLPRQKVAKKYNNLLFYWKHLNIVRKNHDKWDQNIIFIHRMLVYRMLQKICVLLFQCKYPLKKLIWLLKLSTMSSLTSQDAVFWSVSELSSSLLRSDNYLCNPPSLSPPHHFENHFGSILEVFSQEFLEALRSDNIIMCEGVRSMFREPLLINSWSILRSDNSYVWGG